jgi:hypothetical protein
MGGISVAPRQGERLAGEQKRGLTIDLGFAPCKMRADFSFRDSDAAWARRSHAGNYQNWQVKFSRATGAIPTANI